MKLSVLKDNLHRGLQIVSRTVGSRTTLPVLKNVLLETSEGRLKISATDLEIGITSFIGGKIEKEGAITVPAKLLMDYISPLPNKKINLEVKNNLLKLECENYKASFNTINADEFPEIPVFDNVEPISLDIKEFIEGIDKVVFACSRDDSRPVLSAVFMHLNGTTLTLAAADGFRLAEKTIPLKKKVEKELTLLIPHRSLQELSRMVHEEDKEILLFTSQNQLLFTTPSSSLFSRLIEGKFPDYKTIIPQPDKTTTTATIPLNDIEQAIKINHLFAKDDSDSVKLEFLPEKKQITISAATNQLGESSTAIDAQLQGTTQTISFNARYILDALQAIASKDVVFQVTSSLNPGLIKDPKDKEYIYVVMPVKQL